MSDPSSEVEAVSLWHAYAGARAGALSDRDAFVGVVAPAIANERVSRVIYFVERLPMGMSSVVSLDAREQAIREALVRMGWTPPRDTP